MTGVCSLVSTFVLTLTERCLEPDERPADLMDQWEKLDTKKKGDKEECKFIFKKKIFLKDDDREMEDSVAKDLVYKQV